MKIFKYRLTVKHFLLTKYQPLVTNVKPFVPQSLAERIGHARRLLGVREGRDVLIPDLAARVGVTAASVYNWEGGATEPGKENKAVLAKELGVTPEYLDYGIEVAKPRRARGKSVAERLAERDQNGNATRESGGGGKGA